ncbi:hypothetical protein CYY_004662 [Polysphondylium violaceum]|uniref:Uncharacterized protein n=1 Tax=Polysphondylium violaceum TaxID=133409 RepID=A0A8J4PUB3_9MYCE|nr:hypothetical protein CYY_004662 [Polysphondylium violaceum]
MTALTMLEIRVMEDGLINGDSEKDIINNVNKVRGIDHNEELVKETLNSLSESIYKNTSKFLKKRDRDSYSHENEVTFCHHHKSFKKEISEFDYQFIIEKRKKETIEVLCEPSYINQPFIVRDNDLLLVYFPDVTQNSKNLLKILEYDKHIIDNNFTIKYEQKVPENLESILNIHSNELIFKNTMKKFTVNLPHLSSGKKYNKVFKLTSHGFENSFGIWIKDDKVMINSQGQKIYEKKK